ELTQMKPAGVSPFYHMMQFVTTDKIQITQPKDIKTKLNLQHNCHEGHFQKKMIKKNADHNHEADERISEIVDGSQKWKAEVNILPRPNEIIPPTIEDGSISNISETSSIPLPGSSHHKSEASEIKSLVSEIYLN
ncbi:hypothetical protein VP01_4032g2, partial [Puccinia sorghi]